jgi:sterile alpha motif and leucine zipper containing kinase AZK
MYCNSCSTEYIIDLIGAQGTLITSDDVSGSQFQDSNNSQQSSDAIEESVAELCLALEQIRWKFHNKGDDRRD